MFHVYCQVFIRWIAWGSGKKLFLCLVVLVLRALYRRPDSNSSKRECVGCEGSRGILPTLLLILDEYSSLRVGRVVPMIRSAFRTTLRSQSSEVRFGSWAEPDSYWRAEDGFNDGRVELFQQLLRQVEHSKLGCRAYRSKYHAMGRVCHWKFLILHHKMWQNVTWALHI